MLLEDFEVFQDFVVLQEKQAGLNRLRVHGFADGRWKEVAFPEPVYTAFASGTPEFDSKRLRYSYQSLTTPSSVYDYDMAAGTSVAAEARGGARRLRPRSATPPSGSGPRRATA